MELFEEVNVEGHNVLVVTHDHEGAGLARR